MNVSIIIPAYNRGSLLEATLESLVRQNISQNEYEVIVIDDESTDNTEEVTKSFESKLPLRYRRITRVSYNVSRPRNEGLQLANGRIAIFLDAGLVVGSDFIHQHLRSHDGIEGCYCIGHTLAANREDNWLDGYNYFDVEGCVEHFSANPDLDDPRRVYAPPDHPAPWIFFWADNCSVSVENLRKVGAFDEAVSGWGFEDIELGYRLYKLGLKFMICDAWAVHLPHPRAPLLERMLENSQKWRHALEKHQSLEMEVFSVTESRYYDQTIIHAQRVASNIQVPNYSKSEYHSILQELQKFVKRPALIAGCVQATPFEGFGFSASLEPMWRGPLGQSDECGQIYPLLGLQTPFQAKQFKTMVITDFWKELGGNPSPMHPSYLLYLMAQATRIAQHIVILDTPGFTPNVPAEWLASRAQLRQAINALVACPIENPASFLVVPSTTRGFWEAY